MNTRHWARADALLISLVLLSGPAAAQVSSTDAVSVGPGIRYICQPTAPTPTGRARLWVRCSDGHLVYTTVGNVDLDMVVPIVAAVVTNTNGLTASLAGSMIKNGIAVVQSTGSGFITYDNVNWSPLW